MVDTVIEKQLHEQLDLLMPNQQREVLSFARALADAHRASGSVSSNEQLLRFAGCISLDDSEAMSAAIAEGCETVDPHEW